MKRLRSTRKRDLHRLSPTLDPIRVMHERSSPWWRVVGGLLVLTCGFGLVTFFIGWLPSPPEAGREFTNALETDVRIRVRAWCVCANGAPKHAQIKLKPHMSNGTNSPLLGLTHADSGPRLFVAYKDPPPQWTPLRGPRRATMLVRNPPNRLVWSGTARAEDPVHVHPALNSRIGAPMDWHVVGLSANDPDLFLDPRDYGMESSSASYVSTWTTDRLDSEKGVWDTRLGMGSFVFFVPLTDELEVFGGLLPPMMPVPIGVTEDILDSDTMKVLGVGLLRDNAASSSEAVLGFAPVSEWRGNQPSGGEF